jgi:hypothetical protein
LRPPSPRSEPAPAISDQDDAGAWLRREFPNLHYIAEPSKRRQGDATWTGISGDDTAYSAMKLKEKAGGASASRKHE